MKHKSSFSPHYFEYDYDVMCNCDEYGCDEYCRCGQIINFKLLEVLFDWKSIKELFCKKNKSLIDFYCIERILNLNGFYEKGYWEHSVDPGYYGEEMGPFYFSNLNKVNSLIEQLNSKSTNLEKIKFILELEYEFLLPKIKKVTSFSVKKMSIKNINKFHFNENYFKKLNPTICYQYDSLIDFNFPLFVAIKENNDIYQLIDGYHRFSVLKNKTGIKNFLFVEGTF